MEFLVLTMQKVIEGVTMTFDVKRIQSSGNMCKFVTVSSKDTKDMFED